MRSAAWPGLVEILKGVALGVEVAGIVCVAATTSMGARRFGIASRRATQKGLNKRRFWHDLEERTPDGDECQGVVVWPSFRGAMLMLW